MKSTRTTYTTIDEYIATFPADVQAILQTIYYPQLGHDDQQSEPKLQPNLVVFSIRAR